MNLCFIVKEDGISNRIGPVIYNQEDHSWVQLYAQKLVNAFNITSESGNLEHFMYNCLLNTLRSYPLKPSREKLLFAVNAVNTQIYDRPMSWK